MSRPGFLIGLVACVFGAAALVAQRQDAFVASRDETAIQYSKGPTSDRVSDLNRRVQDGSVRLAFDGPAGYLRSTLEALNIPVESQVAVFAQNSSQGPLIGMTNPRALYFADAVANIAAWLEGKPVRVIDGKPVKMNFLGWIFKL
jgi:hypothetical protein